MPSAIRGFLFDMDGVIVDSMPLHTESWRVYLDRHGITVSDLAERMHGQFNDQIVTQFFGEGLARETIVGHGSSKEKLYREMMEPILEEYLVPGIREFLSAWPAVPKAVGSNAEKANIDFTLDKANLRIHFQAFVDSSQVAKPKPAPDVYRRASVLLGLAAEECVVFEDSAAGVEAARAAGAHVVGVETHGALRNVDLAIPNFTDPALDLWLRSRVQTATRDARSGGN